MRDAQRVIQKGDLLNELFLQLAAQQYQAAITTFDAWQRTRAPRPSGQYFDSAIRIELFARAKAEEARGNVSYEQAFRKVFAEAFSKLNDREAHESSWFVATPVSAFQRDLQSQLQRRTDVFELIRTYVNLQAAESFASFVDAAIAADDSIRFTIQTDVRIPGKDGALITAIVVRNGSTT